MGRKPDTDKHLLEERETAEGNCSSSLPDGGVRLSEPGVGVPGPQVTEHPHCLPGPRKSHGFPQVVALFQTASVLPSTSLGAVKLSQILLGSPNGLKLTSCMSSQPSQGPLTFKGSHRNSCASFKTTSGPRYCCGHPALSLWLNVVVYSSSPSGGDCHPCPRFSPCSLLPS